MLHGMKSREGNEAVCAFNGGLAAFGSLKSFVAIGNRRRI
jgi:hypothetical protein